MMDHAEATRRLVAEQYLLGELNDSEREEFEKHFFACPECSESLETGAALISNARAVFLDPAGIPVTATSPGWKKWFGLEWSFAPAAALAGCVVMMVLVGYQNLVQIPALRQGAESGDLAMAPAISIRAARAQQALTFVKRNGMVTLTVVHEWEDAYSRYSTEVEWVANHRVVSKTGIAATPADISVSLRTERLEAGAYLLTVYGLREGSAERTPVARVPFTLTE